MFADDDDNDRSARAQERHLQLRLLVRNDNANIFVRLSLRVARDLKRMAGSSNAEGASALVRCWQIQEAEDLGRSDCGTQTSSSSKGEYELVNTLATDSLSIGLE